MIIVAVVIVEIELVADTTVELDQQRAAVVK